MVLGHESLGGSGKIRKWNERREKPRKRNQRVGMETVYCTGTKIYRLVWLLSIPLLL